MLCREWPGGETASGGSLPCLRARREGRHPSVLALCPPRFWGQHRQRDFVLGIAVLVLLGLALVGCGTASSPDRVGTGANAQPSGPGDVTSVARGTVAPVVGLFPAMVQERWGFIDRTGSVVIEPEYEGTQDFSGGLAPVKKDGKWGYVDATGEVVIQPQFDFADGFSDGLAAVEQGGRVGYIDKTGEFVIRPHLTGPWGSFCEGLAPVQVDGKWGFMDQTGDIVIEPQYSDVRNFSEGLAAVEGKDGWDYIDRTGKTVLKLSSGPVGEFNGGLAPAWEPAEGTLLGEYGFIDKTGQFVIAPQFSCALEFSDDGLAPVQIGVESSTDNAGKWGYIDRTGVLVIEAQFANAYKFHDGLALVEDGAGRLSYIDTTGHIVWTEK